MANHRLRALFRGRRWVKKDWVIATVGFTTLTVFFISFVSNSWRDGDSTAADFVELTLLHNAADRGACTRIFSLCCERNFFCPVIFMLGSFISYWISGFFFLAVCLDGSVPGYHFQKGYGSGSDNWVLHIEVLILMCSITVDYSNFTFFT